MKIELHLSHLLYRYPCVTIPNFGAFLTEIESAKIVDNNTFLPPSKKLSFNSYLKNNDGLLANQISQFSKISYDDAVFEIKTQVHLWNEKLALFGGVKLKNIGDFVLNEQNNLVFLPANQTNFLAESFGLHRFDSEPIVRIPLVQPNVSTEREVVDLNPSGSRQNYLKYAAIVIIGAGFLGTIGYQLYENKIAQETLLVQKKVQQQVLQKIQEATFVIPFSPSNGNNETTIKPFHLVAAAFKNEKNADKEVQHLIQKGYEARKLALNKNGLFPVVYASFASFAQAEELRVEVKKSINPEAWVLIQE